MPKVFISQPMGGLTSEEIASARNEAVFILDHLYEDGYEIIDSNIIVQDCESKSSAWYLGQSIVRLSEADVAIFCKGWQSARGCWLEHEVCIRYGIKTIYSHLA